MEGKAPTARTRARTEITAEILKATRMRLRRHGPGELSLRAVARDVGMVSSAVYRYFPGRDQLLTALLVVAYNELGEAVEEADAKINDQTAYLERWQAVCSAIRHWAVKHQGDYALLYGSPVPGYAAPQDTIPAATRTTLVLIKIVLDAHANGARITSAPSAAPAGLESTLGSALGFIKALGLNDPPDAPEVVLRTIMAWSTIFGTISFELFGHLVGSVSDYEKYFDQVVVRLAAELGL